jgi:SAM-dependent methyltransferase
MLKFFKRGPRPDFALREQYLNDLPAILPRWEGFAPDGKGDLLDVPCVRCPKFDSQGARCTVPFGSPLRWCITAANEFYLRNLNGKTVLEIGCGESPTGQRLVGLAGGYWVGMDLRGGKGKLRNVRSVGGIIQQMPFREHSIDVVFAIQSIEHWGEFDFSTHAKLSTPDKYRRIFDEIWRVLKPGGWAYLDAPIHLHGLAEFVRGDLPAIRDLTRGQPWQQVEFTTWRRHRGPIAPYYVPRRDRATWTQSMQGTSRAALRELTRSPVWLLSIRLTKPA